MGRRSPASASPAPSSRRCWSPPTEPSYWALYAYLFVVNAAAFALARLRLWRWLAITAVVLGALWTLPGITNAGVDALGAHLFHVIAGFALAAALIVSGLLYGPDDEPGKIDGISSGAIGAYLVVAAIMVTRSHQDPAAFTVFTLLAAATVAIAWRTDAALWALPTAGLMTAVVMLQWVPHQIFEQLVLPPGVTRGAIPDLPTGIELHLVLGAALAALFGLAGYAAQGRSQNPVVPLYWSATGVLTPLVILIALYLRIAEFGRSVPFAGLALLLAALYGYATELLSQRETRPGIAASAAVFATGAVAALALALTLALDKGWLTVGLALMVPGIAWISEQRPLPALRALAAGVVVLVLLRVGYEPRIVGDDIGTTPIFNWLLYGYGVPAASFWYAGYLLRRRADDVPARMADAAAILFTVLLAFLEIRHYMTGGNLYAHVTALAEVALQVSVGLAMTIGLERLRLRSHSVVHDIGALAIGAITLAAIVFGLILVLNPFMNTTEFGGRILQHRPARLRHSGPARRHPGRQHARRAAAALSLRRRRDRGDLVIALLDAGSAPPVPRQHDWRDDADHRRRAIHLFGDMARLRRRAVDRGCVPTLAAGAARVGRRRRHHHRQGLSGRPRRTDRHIPSAVLHRPRRRAHRNRLALPKAAIPGARAGYNRRDR